MTKPIISVAIMQLVERGLLALDNPIEMYIPEAKGLLVANNPNLGVDSPTQKINRSLTILDLLTHTSGLSHGLGDSKLDQQLFKALYDETLNYRSHESLRRQGIHAFIVSASGAARNTMVLQRWRRCIGTHPSAGFQTIHPHLPQDKYF